MFTLWLLSLITAGAGGLYWLIALTRVNRAMRSAGSVRDGLGGDLATGRVTVVTPAHDEARVIDACVRTMRAQDHPDAEFIFVLDRCTDDTAAIVAKHAAEDDRIRMVELDHCPEDWAGKCHAAHRGAALATGDWLLFTDADTQFDPGLLRAATNYAAAREADLLSLLSTLTYGEGFERRLQTPAGMHLMRMYPIERVNRDHRSRPFANGQFLLFRREAYERIGGHEAVRDDLLEDLAFARRVKEQGGRVRLTMADQMLVVSMYGDVGSFRRGWKRIYTEACHRKVKRLRSNAVRTGVAGTLLPLFIVIGLAFGLASLVRGDASGVTTAQGVALTLVSAIAFGLMVGTVRWVGRRSGAPWAATLWHPWGSAVAAGLMWRAASDLQAGRPIRWGGREYVLTPR